MKCERLSFTLVGIIMGWVSLGVFVMWGIIETSWALILLAGLFILIGVTTKNIMRLSIQKDTPDNATKKNNNDRGD